jgi:hypothetical protein
MLNAKTQLIPTPEARITMNVKDIDTTKELTAEERAAVQGGSANFGYIGGPELATYGGNSLFSPNTNVQIDTPVQTQTNVDPTTITKNVTDTASVLGSFGTLINQK